MKARTIVDSRPREQDLAVLGLSPDATWEQVKSTYKQLVLAHHPDVNPSSAAASRFQQINASYRRLAELQRAREEQAGHCFERVLRDTKTRSLNAQELGVRLQHSASPSVRASAAYLLGRKGGTQARQLLRVACRDADRSVRLAAVQSLGHKGLPGDLLCFLSVSCCVDKEMLAALLLSGRRIWKRYLRHTARTLHATFKAAGPWLRFPDK